MLWGCGLAGRSRGAQPWDLPLRELEGGLGGTSHETLSQDIQSCPLLEPDGMILFFEKDQRPRSAGLGSGVDGGGSEPSEVMSQISRLGQRGEGGHAQC